MHPVGILSLAHTLCALRYPVSFDSYARYYCTLHSDVGCDLTLLTSARIHDVDFPLSRT